MSVRTVERRRNRRMAGVYPAVIYDEAGSVIGRGRTGNLSESGAFIITRRRKGLLKAGTMFVEMAVPSAAKTHGRRNIVRTVRLACRLVRTQVLGQLLGLGIEFIEDPA